MPAGMALAVRARCSAWPCRPRHAAVALRPCAGRRLPRRAQRAGDVACSLVVFKKEDLVLEKALGTVGYINVSSYTPAPSSGGDGAGAELDLQLMQRRSSQEVSQGGVQARLYQGRSPAAGGTPGSQNIWFSRRNSAGE